MYAITQENLVVLYLMQDVLLFGQGVGDKTWKTRYGKMALRVSGHFTPDIPPDFPLDE